MATMAQSAANWRNTHTHIIIVIDTNRKCSQRVSMTYVSKLCIKRTRSKAVVKCPIRENGTERIYTALVKVGLCHL